MNPYKEIRIFDMPRRVCASFMSLPPAGEKQDPGLADGNIVSEVGPPSNFQLDTWYKPFKAYALRKKRKANMAMHMFGKAFLGQAYAAFLPKVVSLPAVGSSITINPIVTPEQAALILQYHNIAADAMWIVHIPSPIGTGVLVEAYAPELDSSTKTRGVRFRPAGCNTIAFYTPWSNDLSTVNKETGRLGQSGLSLCLRTVEDNTTEVVNTPLNVTVYCCVFNIRLNSLVNEDTQVTIPGLNFIPQTVPPSEEPIVAKWQADSGEGTSTEVQAEGIADLPEQISEDGPAAVIAPDAEGPVPEPAVKDKRVKTTRKPQAGIPNTKWVEGMNITVGSTGLLTWRDLTFDPYKQNSKGENIGNAYRRNVWVTGSDKSGIVKTVRVKIIISRPPSVSGAIEVQTSRNSSERYIVEIGGNVEFDLIPANYAGVPAMARPRYWTSPYLRTDEAVCNFRYRIVAFNRTSDTADVKIRVLFKLGQSKFSGPIKPRSTATTFDYMVQDLEDLVLIKQQEEFLLCKSQAEIIHANFHGLGGMIGSLAQSVVPGAGIIGGVVDKAFHFIDELGDNDQDEEKYVAPYAAEDDFEGVAELEECFDEDLDQDDFITEIWRGKLTNNEKIVIPLNLAIIPDESGGGGLSVIAQKFERAAHVVPTEPGAFGPSVGEYTVETRLPTTVAGNIAHVLLPGDMVDEAVAFAFGLEDILSIATGALQGVGGPLMGAAFGAAKALFGKLTGIGGSSTADNNTASANPPAITGPLDLSRFVQFAKPVAQNYLQDPVFPNLLLEARDFIRADGTDMDQIPARIWAKMKTAGIERSLWDRIITPETSMVNRVNIPYDRWPYLIDRFRGNRNTFIEGTHQNVCFKKFVTCIRTRGTAAETFSITLEDVLATWLTEDDEAFVAGFISGANRIVAAP